MNRNLILFYLFSICVLSSVKAQDQLPETFPLSSVRLLESPFKKAQQTDAQYVLSLDADRLLAPFLKDAGIKPLKANYGNWEQSGLDGHIGGHYITALAQLYAATGDQVFRKKLDYFLSWLDSCQQKNGNGYVGGVPEGKSLWKEVENGNASAVRKRWVPWYNIHKTYAGLVDAYNITGDTIAKKILIKLSEWCLNLCSKLTDEQMEEMLQVEHGGMNEVFANVALISGDKRYIDLAKRFSHKAILNPLMQEQDRLTGLHANTQIPKVVGFAKLASVTKDSQWAHAADFFWHTVVAHRSIAIGGNSVREHFNPVNDFSSMLESREGPESCNSYNMLKLTKELFLAKPSAAYMDYYERTLYNHILSTQHPDGGFVYFTPIRPGHYRVYSSPQKSFWCCVGSGIENHGKYGELIYAHTAKDLYVNLFIPSVLQWKEKGFELIQDNNFPYKDSTSIIVKTQRPQNLHIKIRRPAWLKSAPLISVNAKPVKTMPDVQGYISIERTWKYGDRITIHLPMQAGLEQLPDKSQWAAFVYGPLVLAAATDTADTRGLRADDSRWGHIAHGKLLSMDEAPLLVIDDLKKITLPAVHRDSLVFSVAGLIDQDKYRQLRLTPFYQLHDKRYVLYWPYTSKASLPELKRTLKEKGEAREKLDAATLDVVYAGEQQPESDHNFKGQNTTTGTFKEQHFRKAKGWFSYDLRNADAKAKQVSFMYYGAEKDKSFDVLFNNEFAATITLTGNDGNQFTYKTIEIPAALQSSTTITVQFKSRNGAEVAAIYEVRLLK